ncbi:MAG: NAD(P)H-hydrate dehydratase [Clostridia bacterium]|nr:NAD(P)H-hydrate dehydratase [Clostridia bacterium]
MECLTAAEMQAVDRLAVEAFGLTVDLLMESAGAFVAAAVADDLGEVAVAGGPDGVTVPTGLPPGRAWTLAAPWVPPGRLDAAVAIVAGKGNNGGDGLVAARYLHQWGARVHVFLAAEPDELAGAARTNWERLSRLGVLRQAGREPPAGVEGQLAACDRVVDALLGTGARGGVREPLRAWVTAIQGCGRRVVAVDLPSGLDADTGQAAGVCVRADRTVTFCRPKLGAVLYPGAEACGRLDVAPIPIPDEAVRAVAPRAALVTAAQARSWLPVRPPDTHKGLCGRIAVLAGAVGYAGAPALAAAAALRAGAGLVTLAAPAALVPSLTARLTEVMVRPLPDTPAGQVAPEAWEAAAPLLAAADAVALGPGLGRGEGARRLVARVLERFDGPVVLDADGIAVTRPEQLARARARVVITPHAGELSRLMGRPVSAITADRPAAAREAAARCRVTCLLKGARTLVAAPDGFLWVNPTGNSGMATAGSGDVLTGIIGALLGQGLDPVAAAALGAFAHGLAGDLVLSGGGSRMGLVAGDLLAALPGAWRVLGDPGGPGEASSGSRR